MLDKKYKLFGSDPKGLYALNQELLARVYTAPSRYCERWCIRIGKNK